MFEFISFEALQRYVVLAPGLLIGLICHEIAHGYAAYLLGDPTAKSQGRLNFNPLKHLDLFGTLAFFIFQIGWAKPVPVDPRYFKEPRQGMLLTAIAGPGANCIIAIVFALLMHCITFIPVYPDTLTQKILIPLYLICQSGVFVNLVLGIFNLLPIPPLDGSVVLAYFLPPRLADRFMNLSRYGFIILIGLILGGRYFGFSVFRSTILPIVYKAASLLGITM